MKTPPVSAVTGSSAYQELVTKYTIITDEAIRTKTKQVATVKMRPEEDLVTHDQEASFLCDDFDSMGEPVNHRKFK